MRAFRFLKETTMVRKALLVVAFVAAASSAVQAQDHRVELSGTAGWTFSDGVTGSSGGFLRVDPKDAFSWGARIGFMLNDNIEIGGLFNQQSTQLELGGDSQSVELGDLKINNYHGYIAYNFGDSSAHVRPYFLGGAGATQYGGLTTSFGAQRELGRRHPVLDHLGARREGLPGRQQLRPSLRGPLDAHLHQVGLRGLVVRSLLGLLRGRKRAVREPVGALGRAHAAVLAGDAATSRWSKPAARPSALSGRELRAARSSVRFPPVRSSAFLLIVALVACAVPAAAAPKVDVVVLKNGTRVVGEIRSMSKSSLKLKTDDMGTLQIEWDNITELTAPEFFEVESMNGGLHFGSLRPLPGEQALEIVAAAGSERLALREVARIQLVESGFWEKFKGSFDVGAGYTSATELQQLSFDGELNYRRPRFEASLTTDAVLTKQPDADDTQRGSLTLGYTRLFPNRHRVFAQAMLEQNRELGFDLRGSMVGGWGYLLARNAHNQLVSGAGLSLNREKPVEGESTTNLEATLGFNYANFAYDFPNTDIQVSLLGYAGLNHWGRLRLEASASLRREVFSDFYVGLKGYESYDSEPATQGAQKNDWGLSLTFGYSF